MWRAAIVATLFATLALAVSSIVSTSAEGPDVGVSYVDAARPVAEQSAVHGADLAAIVGRAAELGGPQLRAALERLEADTADVRRRADALHVPDDHRPTQGLLVTALSTRADVARALRDKVGQVLSDPGNTPPDTPDALVAMGTDLRVADRAYELFVDALPQEVRGTMPDARWLARGDEWTRSEMVALVNGIRSRASLAPVHDVNVLTFSVVPDPVTTDNGLPVLPLSGTLRAQIVAANVGSSSESKVAVEVRVQSEGGSDSARELVDLAPGQRRTVVLSVRPDPRGQITLTVRVGPVPGEASTADNEQRRTYLMR